MSATFCEIYRQQKKSLRQQRCMVRTRVSWQQWFSWSCCPLSWFWSPLALPNWTTMNSQHTSSRLSRRSRPTRLIIFCVLFSRLFRRRLVDLNIVLRWRRESRVLRNANSDIETGFFMTRSWCSVKESNVAAAASDASMRYIWYLDSKCKPTKSKASAAEPGWSADRRMFCVW